MFQALVAIYILLILALIVCVRIINKGNSKYRQGIVRLIGVGISTVLSYTLFVLTPSRYPDLATFMAGVYYLATDWLALALMLFVVDYTRIRATTNAPRQALYIIAGADSVSYLANTTTHHIFTVERGIWHGVGFWQLQLAPMHIAHLIFAYLIVGYCICLLLYRLVRVPSIYKGKYAMILFCAAAVIVVNLLCTVLGTRFDYSVLVYGLLAISICYFVLYASPSRLLEAMHSTLVEDSVIGLFVYDDDDVCCGVNQTARALFSNPDDIYSVAEQYLATWKEEHKGNLSNSMGAEREIVKDGETLYLYVNYQMLLDDHDKVIGSGFQFEDRTEVVKRYQAEKYRATHDMLTGLLNRDAFEERCKEILSGTDEPYYMVCTNIKDFKLINELCGTDVGDKILLAQADLIRAEEYGDSTSARMYADKFCTLLPKDHFNAEHFTAKMTELMDRVLSVPFKTHCYFGVYEIEDKTEPVWTMCDKAMMAIDIIRGDYAQSVSFYNEELFHRIIREKEILGEFEQAIEEGQFHMFLQPQIANDGTVVGAEALVRWIHPTKGMVSPGDFIPVLEKAALIHKLDLYMWEQAAKKLEQWKKEGKGHLSISVNISTKDFYLIDIYEAFRALSEQYDFDIKNLKLEITESALMRDVRKIMQNMDELHSLGYDIEIDDFGSGYSSLGMLKDIRADILKIDMIFLQETENVERSTTILKNVISMSKELGMPVITEGVETKEQVDFLQSAGCDMFQGFYFARPMRVEDFEQNYHSV